MDDSFLPKDVLLIIVSFTNYETKFNLWQSCKFFREYIEEFKDLKLEGTPKIHIDIDEQSNLTFNDNDRYFGCINIEDQMDGMNISNDNKFWLTSASWIKLKPIEFLRPLLNHIDYLNNNGTNLQYFIFNGEIKVREIGYMSWVL